MKRIIAIAGLLAACGNAPEVEMLAGPRITASQSADPALAIDAASGAVLLSWVEGDSAGYQLKVARSSDGGVTWSEPVAITMALDEVKPHAEASPRLVAASGVIGAFWPQQQPVPGRRFPASQMRFARSIDGGQSWSPAITLNDDTAAADPAGHTFHGATALGDSTFVVAWLDSRRVVEQAHGHEQTHHDGSSYVFSTSSRDLGATWEPANRKYWGSACPCCRVALAASGDGVLAAWRGHFSGDVRDIVTARLDASQQPERVHADNWSFPGCPHSGPGLAVADERVHVTWFTGAPHRMGVYYAQRGSEPVRVLGGPQLPTGHPTVTAMGDAALVAVNLNAAGERVLTVARVAGSRVQLVEVPNSAGADHPQVLRTGDDRAIVAWTQNAQLRLAAVQL